MFHLIWAIIFIIKLYKSVANKGIGRKFSLGGRGVRATDKDRKIAKKAFIYYICTMFENPGGHAARRWLRMVQK